MVSAHFGVGVPVPWGLSRYAPNRTQTPIRILSDRDQHRGQLPDELVTGGQQALTLLSRAAAMPFRQAGRSDRRAVSGRIRLAAVAGPGQKVPSDDLRKTGPRYRFHARADRIFRPEWSTGSPGRRRQPAGDLDNARRVAASGETQISIALENHAEILCFWLW